MIRQHKITLFRSQCPYQILDFEVLYFKFIFKDLIEFVEVVLEALLLTRLRK